MGGSPRQIQLDQSTFMPLDTASLPRQRSGAAASSSPASAPGPDYSHVQLDPNTFSPVAGNNSGVQGASSQEIPETGIAAGLKRNTVSAITGLFHAFTDPATNEEKQAILQKVREANQKGDKVPEDIATNPSNATLALHRILDAPADELLKKGGNEIEVAKDLMNNHQYWKGGNHYISGLADKLFGNVSLVGPAINSIGERAEGALIPAVNKKGENIPSSEIPAERKDFSGAATDVGAALALENAPKMVKGATKTAGRIAESAGKILNPEEINPAELKEPPRPVTAHTKTELPLDDATIRKSFNKDLNQEARDTLREKVGDTVPAGSSVENTLMKAVAPVNKTIEEQGLALNKVLQNAGEMKTNSATEVTTALEKLKKPFDLEAEKSIRDAIDSESAKAREAMLSKDPVELNNYIRELDKQIKSYTAPAEAVDTVSQARDAAKVTIRRAIRNKLSTEIPETKPINDVLAKNLEARGALRNKFGDVAYDSVAADAQHMKHVVP
jgi:hypothetical protein